MYLLWQCMEWITYWKSSIWSVQVHYTICPDVWRFKLPARWFLCVCLWICPVISQIAAWYKIPHPPIMKMPFAPRTLTKGVVHVSLSACGVIAHLCPDLQHRSQRSWTAIIPSCYCLLLLEGDVELNPGPVCPPCTTCRTPARKNQHNLMGSSSSLSPSCSPSENEAVKLNCLYRGTDDVLVISHLNVRSKLASQEGWVKTLLTTTLMCPCVDWERHG